MKKYTYSKENLDYIKDTLQILLNDVKEIYDATGERTIILPTTLDNDKYFLLISKTEIGLTNRENITSSPYLVTYLGSDCVLATIEPKRKTWFAKQQSPQMIIKDLYKDVERNVAIQFVVEYDHIREELINFAQTALKDKKETMDKIRRIRSKYTNEVLVDLGENTSINAQTIEIQEENGKKVGTIDFGKRLVKIITEGDIVLTRVEETKERVEETKERVKAK